MSSLRVRPTDSLPTSEPVRGGIRKRLDIEGLRAVAILSVLAHHAGIAWLPGGFAGVDVFFVISGFLITTLLVREAERTGRVSLRSFYARRVRRLLPAATVVLLFSAVGTAWLFRGSEGREFGGDIIAAAANLVNWRFAERSVDYLAEDTGESPVLHFWSLAVEEQFYIVWPLLLLVGIWVAHRRQHALRSTLTIGLAVVALPSFAYAMLMAAQDPARGFFVTTTRMWELAIGALIAVLLPRIVRLPRIVANLVGLGGAIAVITGFLAASSETAWPSAITLLPVLGTAAVICAGAALPDNPIGRALSIRPLVWIGGLSYSLYLWHWPLLVFVEEYRGHLGVKGAIVVSAFAVVPAYLSQRFIEDPVRSSRRLSTDRALTLCLGAFLILLGAFVGLAAVAKATPDASGKHVESATTAPALVESKGAAALGYDPEQSPRGSAEYRNQTIVPDPAFAPDDAPSGYGLGCQVSGNRSEPSFCVVGAEESEVTIVATGDSKLFQYFDAFDQIGENRGWRFEVAAKGACSWVATTQIIKGEPSASCDEHTRLVTEHIEATQPDYVLVSGSPFWPASYEGDPMDERVAALSAQWQSANDMGVPVIVLLEAPKPTADGESYECVLDHLDSLESCAYDREAGLKASLTPAQLLAAGLVDDVSVVSLNDYYCPQSVCPAVIGDVLVYRQGGHISNTFALSLVPVLGERLGQVVDYGATEVGPTLWP